MTPAMMPRFLLVLVALLLPAQALANDLEGHWAFRIDEATIFVFTLQEREGGGWTGSWTRPAQIDSNGMVFRNMDGSQTVQPESVIERNGVVQLTFAGPAEARGRNDVLQFSSVSANQAQLNYIGLPGDPYPLVRVVPDTPLGPFEDARIYDRDRAVTEAEYIEPWEPTGDLEAAAALGGAPALDPLDEIAIELGLDVAGGEEERVEELPPLEAEGEGEAEAEEPEEDDESPRIGADFLDGLDDL